MRNKLKLTLTLLSKSIAVFGLSASVVACGASKWHETEGAPNTGDPVAEKQTVQPPAHPMRTGDPGFISSDRLPAPAPTEPKAKAPALNRNDEIQITDPAPKGADGSVEAVVVSTQTPDLKGKKVLLPKAYVAPKPVVPTKAEDAADKYFVVQNIATEKLRVYENCATKDKGGDCVHKLVLETDMAAGQDTPRGRSLLGSYRISEWFKFYEDKDHSYPSYYAPKYPELPKANDVLESWLLKSLLPNEKGTTRGAFGWYTAKIAPNADDQWTHGTIGRGADGEKFIAAAKDPSNSPIFMRSLGCTRVENQAIAFMREKLPVGTKMFKIYAKEGYADATRAAYKDARKVKWSWILTKSGTMSQTETSGARALIAAKDEDVLERGSYSVDQTPDAAQGNVYKIPEASFRGVFLVDEGRVSDYENPKSLNVGGIVGPLPSLVLKAKE